MPVSTEFNGLFTAHVGPCVGPDFMGVTMFSRAMRVGMRMASAAFVRMGVVHEFRGKVVIFGRRDQRSGK